MEFILEVLSQVPFESLIDVGCGDGRLLREIDRRFHHKIIFGVDSSQRAIRLSQALNPGLIFKSTDICSGEIKPHSFDIVTCVEVLEHIPKNSMTKFISAMANLSKPYGRILITVPHKNKRLQFKHFQHFDSTKLKEYIEPYYNIESLVFIDKLSLVTSHIFHNLLENRFFILNNQPLLDLLFRFYRRHLFFCDERNCGRIFLLGRKK